MKKTQKEKYFTGKGVRILVVESREIDFHKIQTEVLEVIESCEFSRVETENDFLAELEGFKPDIIISELCIPHLDCKNILSLTSKQELRIPLIIFTGEQYEDKALECVNEGADDYVIKEHSKRLGGTIIRLLKEKRLRMELFFAEKDLDQFKKYVDRYGRWEANVPGMVYLFVLHPDGSSGFTYVSSVSRRLFGVEPEDIVRDPMLLSSFRHPDDIPDMEKAIKHSAETLEPFRYVTRHIVKGEIRWYHFMSRPEKQPNGDIIWDGIMLDITEQRRTEEALSTEHNLMRMLLDNSLDVIYFKDLNSKFIKVNKGYAVKINAKSEDDILGKTDFDIFDFEHADNARRDELNIIKTGKPVINIIEKEILPSGKTAWVTTTKLPLKNNKGEIIGTFGISRDITELKLIEDALAVERNLLRTLIDALPDRIYVKDNNGKFVINNKAHLNALGAKTQEEAIGKTDFDYRDREIAAQYAKDDLHVIKSGKPMYYREEVSSLASGKTGWHLGTKVPLRDQQGNSFGLVGISHDITESKKLEEQLKSSEARLRNLVTATSAVLYTIRISNKAMIHTWVGDNIDQFGYTASKVCNPDFWNNIVHPDDFDYYHSRMESLFEENRLILEYRIRNKEGNYLWIRDEAVLIRDPFGKPSEIFGSWLDITERMKVEEALLASESQLTNALKIAHLAYWEYDVTNDLFTFNDQFYSLFRTSAENEDGYLMSSKKYIERFVHPDDIPIVRIEIQKATHATDSNFNSQLEYRVLYADGETGYLSIKFNVVKDERGRIIKSYGASQDITERKKAEEALRTSEAQLSDALKIAHIAYWEYDVINDTFTFNDQFYSLFRTTAEKEGGYIMSSMEYAKRFVYPEDSHIVGIEVAKAINTSDPNFSSQLEHRIVFADGEIGYIAVRFFIIKDENGRTVKTYGANQDITERKHAEEALRASEYILRKSQSVARLGSYKLDIKSGKWECSQALEKILGIDKNFPKDAEGQNRLIHPAHREEVNLLLKDIMLGKKNRIEKEYRIVRQNDWQERWVGITGDVEVDREGNPLFMIGTLQDITDRVIREKEKLELDKQLRQRNNELEKMITNLKLMQGTLVQTEKMASLGQLSAGIAHEINNPLAFVSSNINRLKEYFKDTTELLLKWQNLKADISMITELRTKLRDVEEFTEQIDLDFILGDFDKMMISIQEGTGRIKKIVEGMRGFAHISDSSFSEADINQAIDDTLTIVWNEVKYKAVIEKDLGNLPPITCNIGEIKQVFVNLLVNAAHAINEKGTIGIKTSVDDEYVYISIRDTGCGIPDESIKRIFDPFYTTKTIGEGTGLGLWITSSIVDKHNGTITVESQLDKGSIFTVKLPITRQLSNVTTEGILNE